MKLQHPYYPELAIGWRERKPELLSVTDAFMDYPSTNYPCAAPLRSPRRMSIQFKRLRRLSR